MSGTSRTTEPTRYRYRDIIHLGGVILCCLTASGCSLFDNGASRTSAPPSNVMAMSEFPLSALPDIEAPAAAASVAAAARPIPKPRHAPEPVPAKRPTVPNLIGSSEAQVLARLGAPRNRDVHRPAHLWRYVGIDCALDLLFFYDITNDRYRLAMVLGKDGIVEPAQAVACLLPAAAAMALS